METNTQVVYTNWDPCNDVEMLGLTRMPFKEWLQTQDGIYLYAIDFRYNFNSADLKYANLYDNVCILLDDTLEGYSFRSFNKVYSLCVHNNLQNKIVYATGHLDAEQEYSNWLATTERDKLFTVYPMNNWFWRYRDWTVDCGNEVNIDKTVWYCCVQNRARYHRVAANLYLDYHGLSDKGILAANYSNIKDIFESHLFSNSQLLQNQVPFLESKLPLRIDAADTDNCLPMDLNPTIYNTPLINLVSETFYFENDYNTVSEMFITEKTYKAFTAYQIPVIIGPKGTVEKLRYYGFDMFDDIVEHSYDMLDGKDRLFAAIDELKRIVETNNIDELNTTTRQRRINNKQLYLNGLPIDRKVTDYICW